MAMQRYRLTIAYRGTNYHGWQRQTFNLSYKGPPPPDGQGIPTIQEALARALGTVVGHPVNLVGSSRTDAGVHAKGQLAHFDTTQVQIPPDGLRRATNARLPDDIVIRKIKPVPASWDAIRSTESKRYQYAIWNDRDRPALFGDLVWHRWQPLDIAAMRQGAAEFVGTHDFASFAHPEHGRSNSIRTVLACEVSRRGHLVVIGIEGTGFLWNMARIMVGTLVQVGLGSYGPEVIPTMLAARQRTAGGPTAPAHGLYLQWIKTREPAATSG
jgi:tRNA pseudouridine38-40 synthase